ncbi:MAG: DNA mismatch repair protein MutS [Bacteroidota bacterium]
METSVKQTKETSNVETPLMKQYNTIKSQYPDALLLFRVGDFYETFNDDAVKTASILGIVLTKRANGAAATIDLAGFPHHALETYLPKLVRAGQRVAICDQLEDPKTTKTIVKRGVTELVTPGVAFSDKILDHRSNNFLAVIHSNGTSEGIALLDVSTGEFLCSQGSKDHIDRIVQNFSPSEIIVSRSKIKESSSRFGEGVYLYHLDDWAFAKEFCEGKLTKQFGTLSLKGFGIQDLDFAIIAAGAALQYLNQNHQEQLSHINKISRLEEDLYVWLDKFTIRNLELINSPNENAKTLIHVLDNTISPMGSRLMRRWVLMPIKDKSKIEERLNTVEYFFRNLEIASELTDIIKMMGDLERMISRVAIRKITPRELAQLKRSLELIEPLISKCKGSGVDALVRMVDRMNPCEALLELLDRTLSVDPPSMVSKGGVIREGISHDLDHLREISDNGKDHLVGIQKRESDRTGIPSLKVAFNNVFGYYIEVTNTHKDKVPSDWVRKQTLVNAERYITGELKEYEETILGAEGKILELEERLFAELVSKTSEFTLQIQANAACVARLDCLLSFAFTAIENNYCKPSLNEDLILDIRDGRHPVLEKQMKTGESYVPNDLFLDPITQQIIIITGPNMSGKSAILRQTALIVLMAQVGCFVPASSANIGMVDKIFTRVGASDNISSGESTFMVEMNETSSIMNNISDRSLVVLDEIGRGTSTYDGISIAWAIADYLHENGNAKPRTLFATHYHELNEIAGTRDRIKNFHVSVKETENKILFLRKLTPGGSEHSFGIHVAKLAGMPPSIIETAGRMLKILESKDFEKGSEFKEVLNATKDSLQLSIFKLDDPVLERIRDEISTTNIDTLTPVEALMKLNDIKKLIIKK